MLFIGHSLFCGQCSICYTKYVSYEHLKERTKKIEKNNQFLLFFYPKNGVQFTILRTGLPVISTDLPVILAGKLIGTGF
jgi:hypothetical protein